MRPVGERIAEHLRAGRFDAAAEDLRMPSGSKVEGEGLRHANADHTDQGWHDVVRAAVAQHNRAGGLEGPLAHHANLLQGVNWAFRTAMEYRFAVAVAETASAPLVRALRARMPPLAPPPGEWANLQGGEPIWTTGYHFMQACRHTRTAVPEGLADRGRRLSDRHENTPIPRWTRLRLGQVKAHKLHMGVDFSQTLSPDEELRNALYASFRLLARLADEGNIKALSAGGYLMHNLPAMLNPEYRGWKHGPEPVRDLRKLRSIARGD